jgi:hypothetical protein
MRNMLRIYLLTSFLRVGFDRSNRRGDFPGRLTAPVERACRYAATAGKPTPITFSRRVSAVKANWFTSVLE